MHQPVRDLVRNGSVIVYTSPKSTVRKAVEVMARHNVGSILIMEEGRQLLGIFTERDVLRRVVHAGRDPEATRVEEVMTSEVIVMDAQTPRRQVHQVMDRRHIRHIPIAEGDRLLGVISLRDVLRYENEEKDYEIEQLREYFLQEPHLRSSV